jgi:hypothetical protein
MRRPDFIIRINQTHLLSLPSDHEITKSRKLSCAGGIPAAPA